MKHPFKEFVYFSRGERRGIVLLIAGILLVLLIGRVCRHHRSRQPFTPTEEARQAEATAQYDSFIATVRGRDKGTYRPDYSYTPRSNSSRSLQPVPFDPNTADSATLCRMGLPAWMARNVVRYRQKGGRFRKPADFRKIYGLTEETYQTLLPYIYIAGADGTRQTDKEDRTLHDNPTQRGGRTEGNDRSGADGIYKRNGAFNENGTLPNHSVDKGNDTLQSSLLLRPAAPIYKYPAGTVIDLNRADTTELKKIPGIGSAIARMITAYRYRLGGFYRIEQLGELHLDWQRLAPWFSVNPDDIRRINVNRAGIERLRSHPYINFYQATRMVEERRKAGTLHNLKTLSLYDEFTEADLERIERYLSFE